MAFDRMYARYVSEIMSFSLCGFLMAGCMRTSGGSGTLQSPSVTMMPMSVTAAGPTDTPTLEPSVTPITLLPTRTPTTAPPSAMQTTPIPPPELPVAILEDFLFGGETPDCQLPCWQGLRIGESRREDIQHVFDSVFGFNGRDVFEDVIYANPLEGFDIADEIWVTETYFFRILVYVDSETSKLQGITFVWDSSQMPLTPLMPDHLIKKLGTPQSMLIHVEEGQARSNDLRMKMLYPQMGLAVTYFGDIEGDYPDLQFCLNDPVTFSHGELHLIAPFTENLQGLSPLQSYLVRDKAVVNYIAIETATDVSPDDIERLLAEGQNVCLSLETTVYGK